MTPPSADDIADLAERALAAIPARLAEHVRGVGISVEELPDDETLDDLGIEFGVGADRPVSAARR